MEPLTPAEQRTLDTRIQALNLRQFISFFGTVTETCFSTCVTDFTSRSLATRESGCIANCIQKTISATQRLRDRFDEQQTLMVENAQREQ